MKCRLCGTPLVHECIDLGSAPPSNALLSAERLNSPEVFYPLKLFVCHECYLVQIAEYASCVEVFNKQYPYHSSYSATWLDHARCYVEMITSQCGLNEESLVVEIASNDGYLLQYFHKRGVPCLGIEPALSTAEVARAKDIEVITEFFCENLGQKLAKQGRKADLIVANNVLAHVPDINDFVAGIKLLLKKSGTVTIEFPHIMRLVNENQFDTIYHEHYSYLSLHTLKRLLQGHGLMLFNVDELPTHGGSLRVYAAHMDSGFSINGSVSEMLEQERKAGMLSLPFYMKMQAGADAAKLNLLEFLIRMKNENKRVGAYGAAAKGSTLLNYAGVRPDLLSYVVDRNPVKQGKYMPGNRIPIVAESHLRDDQPDIVLILPWNLREEVVHQLEYVRGWGGSFAVAIPSLTLFPSLPRKLS